MKIPVAIAAVTGTLAHASATRASQALKAHAVRDVSVPTVTVRGNGDVRFYIRGVDYQPGGSSASIDPIANAATCRRDVAKFKELGINTVRVYTVDNSPSADHDECMAALADAGIYLALDVNTPLYSINRADPAGSYNDVYLQSVFATVEKFAGYDNTLLFYSGNEVINMDNNTNCAPYVKATTRDIKAYLANRGLRQIPVGYSAADVESNRYEMAMYMNCGPDDQRSDFFAFNDYSWCDPSSFTVSGWDQKVEQYSRYSIPLFLSEFGCITNTRAFTELAALYGPQMTPVYSGGLVYEYSEEGNGYGLVRITGAASVTELPDFATLKSSLAQHQPASGDGGFKPDLPHSACPAASATWEVTRFRGAELPAIPRGAVKYLEKGAGEGPGLEGDGSQWATSGASTGTEDGQGDGEESGDSSSSSSSSSDEDSGSSSGASGVRPAGLVAFAAALLVALVW